MQNDLLFVEVPFRIPSPLEAVESCPEKEKNHFHPSNKI